MKRLLWGMITVMMLMMISGCGSDTTVVVPVTVPPSITALSPLTNDTTNFLIFGNVDFIAPQVDLDFMTVSVMDATGFEVYRSNTDLIIFRGVVSSPPSIPFVIDYATFLPGTYHFTVFLTDLAGALSNPVFGTFSVL